MNKFILGDCMDEEIGLPSFPDKFFDFVIIDPPYGVDYQSSRRIHGQRHKKIQNDKAPYIEWIKPLFNKMADGGRLICFYRWDVARFFIEEIDRAGFTPVAELIWDKVIHGMGDLTASPGAQHETMIYATKGRFEFSGNRPKTIYRSTRVYAENMIHPNEKPEALIKALTRDYAISGDRCADFCAGSNVTGRVWDAMGFESWTYELDPEYYAAAQNRMAKGIQGVIAF